MFVYSLRASTLKFFAVVCVALVALIALIAFVPAYTAGGGDTPAGVSGNVSSGASGNGAGESAQAAYRYDKVKSADDAAEFLTQFGWTVDAGSAETDQVTIPAEFDKVFAGYNEMQKAQGLDLSKYKRKEVTRYTFTVTNYKGYDQTVYANVLVYRNRVIGGDLCSADVSGFIHGFEAPKN